MFAELESLLLAAAASPAAAEGHRGKAKKESACTGEKHNTQSDSWTH